MRPCEVWQQQQDQWTHVETMPCGLFPGGSPGKMFFSALRCPMLRDRIKEPGGATWWEVTDIVGKSADTVQVTVRRCRPPPGSGGLTVPQPSRSHFRDG